MSRNLPEDLHVLCKIQLHATLLQVVLSGHTHIIVATFTYVQSHKLTPKIFVFLRVVSDLNPSEMEPENFTDTLSKLLSELQ